MIKQKNLTDCAICSISMFTGVPYEQVKKHAYSFHRQKYKTKFTGMTDLVEFALLWRYDEKFEVFEDRWESDYVDGSGKNSLVIVRKYIPTNKVINMKKPALLSVPSKNFKNKGHCIYWDGKKLYDPSNMKRYTKKEAFDKAFRIVVKK